MADTIYAFATAVGRSAVSVLRVSGLCCRSILLQVVHIVPAPRYAQLCTLRDPVSREPIDQGIVIWYPAPSSYTGEDCIEFHVHGGYAVRKALLEVLGRMDGCRAADAGEFSRRAFLNGKLDLAELEGLADLLEAETAAQLRQAFSQYRGGVTKQVEAWREQLVNIMARVEAVIDFSDEGDVAEILGVECQSALLRMRGEIDRMITGARKGEVVRDGLRVVIAGKANAGKSSLLNALVRRDVAIVTEIPGTTRDLLEVSLDLDGMLVRLVDTAGIRESEDKVEQIGVERALRAVKDADVVVWVREDQKDVFPEGEFVLQRECIVITINSKSDLWKRGACDVVDEYDVSSMTGAGMEAFLGRLQDIASQYSGRQDDTVFVQARQLVCLKSALSSISKAAEILYLADAEIVAEELRRAALELGRITGRIGAEEILGSIFTRFCVGK